MMNGVLWLRISSIVSLLFTAGHTLGGTAEWSPVGDNAALSSMRTVHFNVEGVSRSFLDFYRGFGFTLSVFLLLQTVMLWQLAATARTQPQTVRPLVASFAIASFLGAGISWAFLFPMPAVFATVQAVCLLITWVTFR